MLILIKFKII